MNTDIKDLFANVKIGDPASVMALVGLLLSTVAFILVLTGGVRAWVLQRNLRTDYRTVTDAIESIMAAQQDTPASLQARIDEEQAQLAEMLAVYPTEPEVTDEVNRYYQYASYYGAQLVSVESTGKVALDENSPVLVESYNLTLSGQTNDLLSFVKHLADGAIETLVITQVTLEPADPAVASIRLDAYYVPAQEEDLPAAPSEAPTPIPMLTLEATPATP